MEKIKITEENKTDVCREIKEELKEMLENGEYGELAVIYDTKKESFYTTSTANIQKEIYNGKVIYKTVIVYKSDNPKLTIKNLKERVFYPDNKDIVVVK